MAKFSRRQFLKTLGIAGGAALAGCSEPSRYLIPYVIPPEDIVPGEAIWYASTCRECPAGCGILVKTRDGHVIKVEGNPLHPINTGKLCARGQASVQGLYNPDRFKQPMIRDASGKLRPLPWDDAMEIATNGLNTVEKRDIVFMSHLMTGTQATLAKKLAGAMGGKYIVYEPYAYESLRKANQIVFGDGRIPDYHIDKADFLISFGANFLETWVSNVEFTRQFAAFHEPKHNRKNIFIYVGPRLSLTAANADYWLSVPVGGERMVALGLLNLVLNDSGAGARPAGSYDTAAFTPRVVEENTGVKSEILRNIARLFSRARRPLALAEGMGFQDPEALETAVAANLLCTVSPQSRDCVDFSNPMALSEVSPAADMKNLTERMAGGKVGALMIYRANPAYSLPRSWGFENALQKIPLVISFSSFPDETTNLATLIMPANTFIESWGDYQPQARVTGLLQPAMGRLFNTRQLGDIFLALGRKTAGGQQFREKDFYEVLRRSWASPDADWQKSLARGGDFGRTRKIVSPPGKRANSFSFSEPPKETKQDTGFDLITYPTIQFFDGHLANRPVLQEIPDPVTMIAWDGWVEINPRMAKVLGIKKGDIVTLNFGTNTVRAPAFPYLGVPANTLAMPIGHGHALDFSRYAGSGDSGNPKDLLSGGLDSAGGLIRTITGLILTKTQERVRIASADGDAYQHGRHLAQDITFVRHVSTRGTNPTIDMPLPEGWNERRDFYPAHRHVDYRWAMAVDIDRCIGCQACVAACYMENNVGIVGKDNIILGRQMSWIHIERYYEAEQPFVRFLPMLCQHCDNAPCESVCPLFAPQHNPEGINNQVYNRCIGTRDCNINCPWKVRRFNWFTWPHDYPLGWQLNPDVTVRQKGVMEKCSFCIQRVVQAKTIAKSEGRKIRDGEFTTACAQTCPADAIVFGNLMDPLSRVSQLIQQSRAYQVLGRLNTKPAVIYLKKITQKI